MDTLSHAVWGRGLFGYRGMPWIALFFGAMPDLVSFGALIIINIISGNIPQFGGGPPPLDALPNWVFLMYDISHSYVTAFSTIAVVYYFKKKIAFAMLGWPFHILLDFPFHSKEYFPTKLFYPLTDFYFDGIPWSNPFIWFPNIIGIAILFYWRKNYRNKKN